MSQNFLADRDLKKTGLYFHIGDYNGTVQIRRVEDDVLWVDYLSELFLQEQLECFIVAKNDRGIIRFVAQVMIEDAQESGRLDVVGLKVVPGSNKLVNRREFVRVEKVGPHAIKVYDQEKRPVPAKLVNLSASGARVEIEGRASMDGFYHMEFESEWLKQINFQTAFKVIHINKNQESQNDELGVIFLKSVEQKIGSPFGDAKQEELVRWINQVLIEARRKEA
ncbi:PilZ domain-containing protein [bacterium]|nr:PilZ domain-containing protein [bacterium]